MIFKNQTFESRESKPIARIEVEPNLDGFIPEEFRQNPIKYFERNGQNIKSGEIKQDETGRIYEDPTAVKELPIWTNASGKKLQTIGKRVNIGKGKVGESGDPFYEYKIMEIVTSLGLPAPHPVAKVEQNGRHLIIMEKVQGISWHKKDIAHLKEKGCTEADIEKIKRQAEEQMVQMQIKFEEAGIIRGWKMQDMIFDIDIENRFIRGIIPVDWERTKIDREKLQMYKEKKSL